jgi:hypothetical protein
VQSVNEVLENGGHKSLKGGWGITKAKGHDKGFKKAKYALESCFPLIAFLYSDVVISLANIKFGKVTGALEFVYEIGDQGKWCGVFNSDVIEISVVLDRA